MNILDFANNNWQDLDGLASFLNDLSHDQRVAETRRLGKGRQKTLYAAVEGRNMDLDYFVPDSVPDMTPVHHIGWNSMPPGFRSFEKRMLRPEQGAKELWGYNEGHLRPLVGNGYFVVEKQDNGEVGVNYYRVPTATVSQWPSPISENNGLISSLVYGKMVDVMRKVSDHVSIGRAVKKGKLTGNYFVLVRQDL